MKPRSRLTRATALVFAILHLLVFGAAEIAEARYAAASADQRAHIESEAADCGRLVHPEHCLICQFLTAPKDSDGDSPAPRWDVADVLRASSATDQLVRAATFTSPTLPRAPPLHS